MPEIETHSEIPPISSEWETLALRIGAPPFLRPGWISAWWDAFGKGELAVLTARREGELVGVLPAFRRAGVLRSTTNWHTPLYGPVAADEGATLGLLGGLLATAPRRADLAFLDSRDPTIELLRLARPGYRITGRTVMRSPYVPVDTDWDAYWSSLSGNLRGTVRRCRHRLEDRGEVAIQVGDGRDALDELLDEGFGVESAGWQGEAGTAIASRAETRLFYTRVARWAAGAGLLRLAFLRVGGSAVAFNLALETEDRHYLLKLGYDARLKSAGPGTVLTSEMVARAFSLSKSYEFLGGDDPYKLRWTSHCHDRVRVQAFAPTPAGTLSRLAWTYGAAAIRRARSIKS